VNADFRGVDCPRVVQLFLIVAALTWLAAGPGSIRAKAQMAASTTPAYAVGGVSVALPAPPGNGMVELGDDRTKYNVVVPDSNRLVAAFVPEKDVPAVRSNGTGSIDPYAMVEVMRTVESTDVSASDFKDLVNSASQQMGAVLGSSFKESEDEFNKRMKAMNLDTEISYGKPVMLGTLFFKIDAYGFGMIAPVTANGTTVRMVVGGAIFRAKNRVLFAYFYAVYKDDQTVGQVRAETEQWTDAILAANR